MGHDDRSMPLTAHLDELRTRLIRSLLAVGIVFAPAYFFADRLFAFLTRPLLDEEVRARKADAARENGSTGNTDAPLSRQPEQGPGGDR